MNSRQKNILLGGALVAGSIVGCYVLYSRGKDNKKKPAEPSKTISRDLAIRVLKEISREMFSVLTNIAMISNQLKEQTRGRIPHQEIKELLLNQNSQTKDQIKNISESICEKYGFEEKDLRYACEVTYQDDKEIRILLNDAKTVFDKAFMGVPPDLRTDIPAFLTPELTLTLMKKMMKESLFKIQDFLTDLKSKGVKISYDSPQVLMALQDLNLDGLRKKILIDEGLDKFQDPPMKIFQYATQKFSTEDPDQFNQKLMKLELQNQKAMDALMKDSADAPIIIEAIGAHLAKDSNEIIASHIRNSRLHKAAVTKGKKEEEKEQEKEKEKEGEEQTEELKALEHIRSLQHQVSFQLKNALEDSDFPQELVQSAVNTLFNVFDNINKNPNDASKNAELNTSVKNEENIENKETGAILENQEPAIVTETQEVEVKEVKDEQGNEYIQTTTEDKIVIESGDKVEEIIVQETTQERVEENNAAAVEENNQGEAPAESQNEQQNE